MDKEIIVTFTKERSLEEELAKYESLVGDPVKTATSEEIFENWQKELNLLYKNE
jgi:hypothetical protein